MENGQFRTIFSAADEWLALQANWGLAARHIAIIPDGTRRWALSHSVPLVNAYVQAFTLLGDMLQMAFDTGAQSVSIFLLSKANLRRSSSDLQAVFSGIGHFIRGRITGFVVETEIELRVAGDLKLLPDELRTILAGIPPTTSHRRIYLCLAYDPIDELEHAIDASEGRDVRSILRSLWVPEPVDLLVRTSGAELLSNFLPLQCGYARLFFLPELFNDLTLERFSAILSEYPIENRRFGE